MDAAEKIKKEENEPQVTIDNRPTFISVLRKHGARNAKTNTVKMTRSETRSRIEKRIAIPKAKLTGKSAEIIATVLEDVLHEDGDGDTMEISAEIIASVLEDVLHEQKEASEAKIPNHIFPKVDPEAVQIAKDAENDLLQSIELEKAKALKKDQEHAERKEKKKQQKELKRQAEKQEKKSK